MLIFIPTKLNWAPWAATVFTFGALLAGCGNNSSHQSAANTNASGTAQSTVDVAACTRTIVALDPEADARRDIASGTARPFFYHIDDPSDETYAPGLIGCGYDPASPTTRTIVGYSDPGFATDMPSRKCSAVMMRYRTLYNRALREQSADHLRKVCGGVVRLDPYETGSSGGQPSIIENDLGPPN